VLRVTQRCAARRAGCPVRGGLPVPVALLCCRRRRRDVHTVRNGGTGGPPGASVSASSSSDAGVLGTKPGQRPRGTTVASDEGKPPPETRLLGCPESVSGEFLLGASSRPGSPPRPRRQAARVGSGLTPRRTRSTPLHPRTNHTPLYSGPQVYYSHSPLLICLTSDIPDYILLFYQNILPPYPFPSLSPPSPIS